MSNPIVNQGAISLMSTLSDFPHLASDRPKLTARQQQILELIQTRLSLRQRGGGTLASAGPQGGY